MTVCENCRLGDLMSHQATQLAAQLVSRFRTNDPLQLIHYSGIWYFEHDLPMHLRGYTIRINDQSAIVVNRCPPEILLAFTRAHELGHALLHGHDLYLSYHATLYPRGRYEREADEFAQALLHRHKEVS